MCERNDGELQDPNFHDPLEHDMKSTPQSTQAAMLSLLFSHLCSGLRVVKGEVLGVILSVKYKQLFEWRGQCFFQQEAHILVWEVESHMDQISCKEQMVFLFK